MYKFSASIALLAAMGMPTVANAINNGKLDITGTLTAITCDIQAGAGTRPGAGPGEIAVDMGNVSFSEIGLYEDTNLSTATPVQLQVVCAGGAAQYNTVEMRFRARDVGLDLSDRRLLRTNGQAKGVGLGLADEGGQLKDLGDPTSSILRAPFNPDGNGAARADFKFSAVYIKNGEATAPGNADAVLPFVMDYL